MSQSHLYNEIMDKRDIGAEILEGIKEIQQHKRGEISLKTNELSEQERNRRNLDRALSSWDLD